MEMKIEFECRPTWYAAAWIYFCVAVHFVGGLLCLSRTRWITCGAHGRVNGWAIRGWKRLVWYRMRIVGGTWGRWQRGFPEAA